MTMLKDTIIESVVTKFRERSEAGVTLDRDDLSFQQWLTHLQEELMDAINYIEKLKHISPLNDITCINKKTGEVIV